MYGKAYGKHLKFIFMIIFLLFVVSSLECSLATDIDKNNIFIGNNIKTNVETNSTSNDTLNTKIDSKKEDSKTNTPTNISSKSKSKIETGCCSIILQINSSAYTYAYRRDSTYAANLYIKKVKLYGIEALKEYKTTNTYFFHSIIFKNGWYLATGGSDNPKVNKYLQNLGAKMVYKNTINSVYMKKAMKKVKSLGLGHFVIKAPNGKVGVVIYNYGVSKLSIFKMKSGEYLSIPNSPNLFRHNKYTVKKNKSVDAAIYIAGTDKFGVNRRNIIVYNVENFKYKNKLNKNKLNKKTLIKIWVSNDNGRYVGRNTGNKADNVIFKGKTVYAGSIPKIPNKRYIGKVLLK
ncbi:hypothetical protein MARBORIA2_07230 [Methanobrevibacter arboriphilus]|jgi:hypothetical protein|uniref:Uncharacterized protein n=1 Tax=Methanobrevibacter arboriphilus TaxID=39441 RepID=A0ACA8R563_METAZ|nr:hypothetical protein [Methanobrevibacter arboriphilus]MCC7561539.1 hypothetical protein [Methanobrevibacter arboriphilus]BBL62491.1 hypothetical protein MarbSA_15310 [Methanobrevibacter arboriphilus]GLI11633.1 hypothetical protein MARBORIA2_07230 [Methanobrevibacter arboriphilus]